MHQGECLQMDWKYISSNITQQIWGVKIGICLLFLLLSYQGYQELFSISKKYQKLILWLFLIILIKSLSIIYSYLIISRTILEYFSIFHSYSRIGIVRVHQVELFAYLQWIELASSTIMKDFSSDRRHGLLKPKIRLITFQLPFL